MLNKNSKKYSHNKKIDGKGYTTKASSKKGKSIIKGSKPKGHAEKKLNSSHTGSVKDIPAEVKKTMPKLKTHLAKLETQNKKLHSAQLKFKKERKKYSDVFEYAPVGYIIINKKDIIQEANRAACKMLGVSRSGLINKTIADFILKEDRIIYYKLIKNIFTVWGQHSCELRMVKPKANKFYVSIEVSILNSGKEQPALYGVCIIDIDQRKSVEGEVKRHESLLENLVYEKTLQWININEKLTREVEALKESEDNLLDIRSNLNEAQELAHLGSWRWEIIPDEIYWSDETYRIFGWEPGEEIDFNKYLNAVLEEDKELVKEKVKAAVEEIKPYENEYRILRNGEIRFHHTIGKIYCDGDGKPIRMVGTVQDITDRKRAEEKLLNSYAWIEAIFEGSRDAVFVSDSESRFKLVNQAACLLTGYTKKELLNMTIQDLHDPQDLNAYLSFHERIMSGEELLTEAKILTKDGHKVDTEFNNKRIIINRINYMHSSARDVSERKKMEEALYVSEDRYRDLVENSYSLICTHDLEGNILSANPAASRLLGYDYESIMSMNIRDIIAPEFKHLYKYYISEISKNGAASGLFTVQTKNGEKRIWEFNNSLRTEGTNNPIVRGMAYDITERKNAEKSLQESEERLRTLIENSEDLIFIQDLKGNYIYYNGSSKYGLSQNDVIGKTFRDLHELKYARKFEERFQKICTTGERIVEETELEWKGERYWFHDNLYPIKGSDGSIKSIATISHNITRLKNAYFDIKQNEELFQNIFKSIPGLATLWHRNNQNKILLAVANEGSYLESKGKIRELIGIEVYDFFTNNPEPAKYITNTMNSGGSNNLVYKIKLRTTGKIKWFYADFVRVTENLVLNIAMDISEREQAREELQKNKEELRKLTQHLQSIREDERGNIAREIHDDLGQMLTALKMDLAWLKKEADLKDKPVNNKIDIMSGMIDSTIKTVQRLSAELRPGILDDLGLPAAIEWLTEEIQKRTNINFELTIIPENILLEEHLSINVFRMIQETLTNVVRHSKATNVQIRIEVVNGEVYINLKDNGVGIPLKKIHDSNSLGLIGIRERASYWNGTVDFKGEENAGTEVSIRLLIK